MTINCSKIIFLNLVVSVLTFTLFYADTTDSMRGVIFLGFISSLFFKENLLRHFLGLMLINALFFHSLSVLIAHLGWITIDIITNGNSNILLSPLDSRGFIDLNVMLYSCGYVVGIVPQYIRERIQKSQIS